MLRSALLIAAVIALPNAAPAESLIGGALIMAQASDALSSAEPNDPRTNSPAQAAPALTPARPSDMKWDGYDLDDDGD